MADFRAKQGQYKESLKNRRVPESKKYLKKKKKRKGWGWVGIVKVA